MSKKTSQKFKLIAPFKAAGDQPQAIEKLMKGLESGVKDQVLLGVTGSGKSLTSSMPVWLYEGQDQEEFTPKLVSIGHYIDQLFSAKSKSAYTTSDGTEILPMRYAGNNIHVPSLNPVTKSLELKPIYAVTRHKSPKTLYRVETDCGRTVEVTGDHNFYVLRDGEFVLVKTTEIKKGDFIPLPFCFDAFAPSKGKYYFDLIKYCKEEIYYVELDIEKLMSVQQTISRSFGDRKLSRIKKFKERLTGGQSTYIFDTFPDLQNQATISSRLGEASYLAKYPISNEWLEFTGYFVAEGHSTGKYLTISLRETFMKERGVGLCANLNYPVQFRADGDIQINHKVLADVYKNLCGAKAGEKRLPEFWTELDRNQLRILLSAYFSGDGCVESDTVSACTKSIQLASDICYALMRFDIWARIRKKRKCAINTVAKKRRTYYEISITGQENLYKFAHYVGFKLPRKQKKLNELLGKKSNTNVDIIPLNNILKKIRCDCGISQKYLAKLIGINRSYISMIEHGVRYPSRNVARKIISALKTSQSAFAHPLFSQMVFLNNCRWTPIKKITPFIGSHKYVYDFLVEDNETFLAGYGGLFVHNTFTVASVIEKIQKPTLIISHNKTLAAQLFSEFKEFFPENAVDYFVSYYDYYQPEAYMPATDTYIEKDAAINEEISKFRHSATMHLLTRKDVIIVASVSCIYGLGSVKEYEALAVTLKKGENFQRDKLLRRLTDIQYVRSSMEFKQGMFHVLGDTVEIFPPGQDTIFRLEFFGDEIENITEADSFTGEVIKEFDEITVFPAKHDVTTEDRIKKAVSGIRTELDEHVKQLQKMGKNLEAERIRTRTEYDLEIMLETGYCTGIENYTRYLNMREPGQEPETLLDYFPDDFLLVIDESHMTIPQIGGMHNGNFSRKQTLIDYGFRLPSAHDNRPLKFDEFQKHMRQAIYISATPSEFEMKRSGKNITEQIVRPTGLIDPSVEVRPTKGQILDLISEIKKRIKNKERTLITTLTKRSAEDLTDYLVDVGLKVKYLHSDIDTLERVEILRDLRLGKFDVLVGINLLREGLDLPEVSLIAILDADKEGFLRSTPALIQTIGRCARNVNGTVIMYADKITRSMKGAIDETDRRRTIQVAYNKKHDITPQTIVKAVRELQTPKSKNSKKHIDTKKIPHGEMGRFVRSLEDQMELAVQNLEFEKAAELRDEIDEIKGKFNL